MRAEAKLAWQAVDEGLRVFANGVAACFDGLVLEGLVVLCEQWELSGDDFAGLRGNEAGIALLDFLLENECIDVE